LQPGPGGGNTPPPVTLSANTLGVLTVIDGGTTNDYFNDLGINLESTTSYLTMLIPSTVQGAILDQITSYSFAEHSLSSYRTDDRLFQGDYFYNWPQRLDLVELDPETLEPLGSAVSMSDSPDEDNLAIIGNKIYYRQSTDFDALCQCTLGGEYRVRDTGLNTTTTLLPRVHAQNSGLTVNVADNGILYAIDLDIRPAEIPPAAHVLVRRRSQTTGAYETTLRDYSLTDYVQFEDFWSFKVSNGVLYILRKRDGAADHRIDILGASLVGPLQSSSDPSLIFTSDEATGNAVIVNSRVWDVDNGRVVIMLGQPTQVGDQVLVVDRSVSPVASQIYTLGPGTDIFHLRALFRAS
jgi:hypothetical protein